MYITGDCRNMSATEQQKTRVRCGRIDPARVFKHLCGYHADESHITATKAALDAASPYLTRCQYDLLSAEFGVDETTIAELSTPTDALFDYPVDANSQKLEVALAKISEYLHC